MMEWVPHESDIDKYAAKVEELHTVFQSRFSEFAAEENNIALFTNPFTFPEERISLLNADLQLEVIDLQSHSVLKCRFSELPAIPAAAEMIDFWRMLPVDEFQHLRSFAKRYVCRFGSTDANSLFRQ